MMLWAALIAALVVIIAGVELFRHAKQYKNPTPPSSLPRSAVRIVKAPYDQDS